MTSDLQTPTEFLEATRQRAEAVVLPVRDLLAKWGAKRRGYLVVERITKDLSDARLVAEPPLDAVHINGSVALRQADGANEAQRHDTRVVPPQPPVAEPEVERDGRLHVGSVASAMSPVVHVARNQPIERAQTLMMRDDYSQLAVMAGSRSLDGAVSWESIARASLRGDVTVVADALVSEVVIVNLDDDLLATVPRIIENGFVFVRARDAQISGIVTTADLSSLFVDLANPFLLVGEIERVLRRLAERHFSVDELATMRDPADASRRVSRVSDLTFGEHARLLEDPSRWGRLGWRIDRALFLERLHQVREIRNEVMHFSPDPLDADDVEKLKGFIRWLRELEPAL